LLSNSELTEDRGRQLTSREMLPNKNIVTRLTSAKSNRQTGKSEQK